jgi:uncharacterized protein with PQ loop repeat
MFAILAIPLAAYVLYAAVTGEVWVKSGAGARLVTRADAPIYFWTCVTIYAGLAIALATIF